MTDNEIMYTLNELDWGYNYLNKYLKEVADDFFDKFEQGSDFSEWDLDMMTSLVLVIKNHPDYEDIEMSKFTPGPWELLDMRPDQCILIVSANLPNYVVITRIKNTVSKDDLTDEDEANAHLIAAAPDMYEALIKANKALQEVQQYMQIDKNGIGPDCTNLFQALIDSAYVLTKARGES